MLSQGRWWGWEGSRDGDSKPGVKSSAPTPGLAHHPGPRDTARPHPSGPAARPRADTVACEQVTPAREHAGQSCEAPHLLREAPHTPDPNLSADLAGSSPGRTTKGGSRKAVGGRGTASKAVPEGPPGPARRQGAARPAPLRQARRWGGGLRQGHCQLGTHSAGHRPPATPGGPASLRTRGVHVQSQHFPPSPPRALPHVAPPGRGGLHRPHPGAPFGPRTLWLLRGRRGKGPEVGPPHTPLQKPGRPRGRQLAHRVPALRAPRGLWAP